LKRRVTSGNLSKPLWKKPVFILPLLAVSSAVVTLVALSGSYTRTWFFAMGWRYFLGYPLIACSSVIMGLAILALVRQERETTNQSLS